MAKRLLDWLHNELVSQAQLAIAWKKCHSNHERPSTKVEEETDSEDDSDRFSDNSSCITVEITRSTSLNSYVQILRIQHIDDTSYDGVVTDGYTQINARFDDAAVSRLEKESGLKMSQLQEGLINLRAFSLHIHRCAPSDKRLTLGIEMAKYLKGSARSGSFGHPRPFTVYPEVQTLLKDFALMEAVPKRGVPGTDVLPAMDESKPATTLGPRLSSQLATQAYIPNSHIPDEPRCSNNSDDIADQRNNLLALLPTKRATKQSDNQAGKLPSSPQHTTTVKATAPPTSCAEHVGRGSDTNTLVEFRDMPGASHNDKSMPTKGYTDDTRPVQKVKGDITSPIKAREAPPGPVIDPPRGPRAFSMSQQTPQRAPDWKFIKYAIRPVPAEQVALLSNPGSWIPAPPGQRFPQSNVPLSVLQSLSSKRVAAKTSAGSHSSAPIMLDSAAEETDNTAPALEQTMAPDKTATEAEDKEDIDSSIDAATPCTSWASSPIRSRPGEQPGTSRLHDELPPDSSVNPPVPESSPLSQRSDEPPSSPKPESLPSDTSDSEMIEHNIDSDLDMPAAVPRRLNRKKSPPMKVEVAQSIGKQSSSATAPRPSQTVPATPIGLPSPRQPKTSEQSEQANEAADTGRLSPPPKRLRLSSTGDKVAVDLTTTPPRMKTKSSKGIFDQDELDEPLSQDPAAKQAKLRHETWHAMRRDHERVSPENGHRVRVGSSANGSPSIKKEVAQSIPEKNDRRTSEVNQYSLQLDDATEEELASQKRIMQERLAAALKRRKQMEKSWEATTPEPGRETPKQSPGQAPAAVAKVKPVSPVQGIPVEQLGVPISSNEPTRVDDQLISWPPSLYGDFGCHYHNLPSVQDQTRRPDTRVQVNVLGWQFGRKSI